MVASTAAAAAAAAVCDHVMGRLYSSVVHSHQFSSFGVRQCFTALWIHPFSTWEVSQRARFIDQKVHACASSRKAWPCVQPESCVSSGRWFQSLHEGPSAFQLPVTGRRQMGGAAKQLANSQPPHLRLAQQPRSTWRQMRQRQLMSMTGFMAVPRKLLMPPRSLPMLWVVR